MLAGIYELDFRASLPLSFEEANFGTIFECNSTAQSTCVTNLTKTDGKYLRAGLTEDAGTLYGTTSKGGPYGLDCFCGSAVGHPVAAARPEHHSPVTVCHGRVGNGRNR